ncbi:spore coat protein [Tumebacillus sp. DT12]|uniref:Spore coat protein n=1 Tax=Tumebacillus lacus TaxID=2995335 RepID=A0ABT3X9V9_9BACL|nr:spore coat protein [Tumebacillus lacus]MCX7571534.1 spore coat protein [Tumebacillus lacus]
MDTLKTDDLAHLAGLDQLVDPGIAMDLLLATKTAIRNGAIALSESITPQVRGVIHKHLELSILFHGQLTALMISKGWFHPYHVTEQFTMDTIMGQMAIKVGQMPLYPDEPTPAATRLESQ